MDSAEVHRRVMAATGIHLILLACNGFWWTYKFRVYYWLSSFYLELDWQLIISCRKKWREAKVGLRTVYRIYRLYGTHKRLQLVRCRAQLQAVGRAKPSPFRPS